MDVEPGKIGKLLYYFIILNKKMCCHTKLNTNTREYNLANSF